MQGTVARRVPGTIKPRPWSTVAKRLDAPPGTCAPSATEPYSGFPRGRRRLAWASARGVAIGLFAMAQGTAPAAEEAGANRPLQLYFRSGRLNGLVQTFHPDGKLASETRYQNGREDGLARSFYASAIGGRLKSEAHLEGDDFVGTHRLFDRSGALTHTIDWQALRHTSPTATPPPTQPNAKPAPPAAAQNLEASRSN
jgi:hypothetical protein